MAFQIFTPRDAVGRPIKLPTSLKRTVKWLPQIGDIVPDFTIETTKGMIQFWDWAEGSWVHLFSVPKAKSPVSTTFLASLASCADAWESSNVKNLALSRSTVSEQIAWHDEIEVIFRTSINFPGAYDHRAQLSRLLGMVHEKKSSEYGIHKSFIIDPAHRIGIIYEYPPLIGRNAEEILRVVKALQLGAASDVATPAGWYDGDLVLIPDDRPEENIIAEFGARSTYLTDYLRVVTPRSPDVDAGD